MGRIRKKRQRMLRLAGLLLLAAAALIVILVFRVQTVVVNGNIRWSGQEIAEGLSYDFLTQNTLFLTWKHRNGEAPERLPYLSSLRVKLDSPGKITVTVTEKELLGYVLYNDQNLYFDEEGVILEISDEIYDGIPVVTGVKMGEPVLYQKVPTDSSAQLRTILSITQLLRYQELTAEEIRFAENMDITVRIGSVDAILGQDEYLEEKIANLRAILNVMNGNQGTLHMENFTGKNEPVSFAEGDIPEAVNGGRSTEDEQQTEQESETSAVDSGDEEAPENENGEQEEGGEDTPDGAEDGNGVPDEAEGNADGGDGSAEDTPDGSVPENEDGAPDGTGEDQEGGDSSGEEGDDDDGEEDLQNTSTYVMAFDSSGTLRYDAHIVNGVVVDANGTPIDGCSVTEDGNIKDAYWNVIDPQTGQPAQ